jgi:bifunctional NMN adenylyltransferase/nudix hydrolase
MDPVQPEGDVGIIVGRFQVPYLHEAHVDLIQTVSRKHKRVAIFLGIAPRASRINPLPFEARAQMIREKFPDVILLPIADVREDDYWVEDLEHQIGLLFPTNTAVLYGSRESFTSVYKNYYQFRHREQKYPVVDLKTEVNISGTKLRAEAANSVLANEAFRTGVIFAYSNMFHMVVPTVDFAITRHAADGVQMLLAKRDSEKKYRFPGGHVDTTDGNLEIAVRRESGEETQVAVASVKYLGSSRINGWKYHGTGDVIMTTLFECEMLHGPVVASDDIDEVRWFDYVELRKDLVELEHEPLMTMFIDAHAVEIANLRAGRT